MKRYALFSLTLLLSFNCLGFQQSNFSAFVYHRFGDDRYPSTNISLENFEQQLTYFAENDISVLTFTDALERLKKRKEAIPIAVITIDDAYKSFYENGWPLLKKYGVKATLFINTETVGASQYMDWDQIREVSAAGIEIGNHSHAHPYFLDNYNKKAFIDDLLLSQKIFQREMGELPKSYAYPYGEWNSEMADVLDSIGYDYATAQNSGPIYKGSPIFHLPRFPMSNDYAEPNDFKQKLIVDALEVTDIKVIEEGHLGSRTKPRLLLSFNEAMYDLKTLQCFIQGSTARKSVRVLSDKRVELSVWPVTDLTERRTLFTVTVTDHNGNWHWFSYLHVQAKPGQ